MLLFLFIHGLSQVDAVASKLAAARNGQVVSAKAITKGGVLFYNFEFTVSDMHQVKYATTHIYLKSVG
jgi:hypothetical protein